MNRLLTKVHESRRERKAAYKALAATGKVLTIKQTDKLGNVMAISKNTATGKVWAFDPKSKMPHALSNVGFASRENGNAAVTKQIKGLFDKAMTQKAMSTAMNKSKVGWTNWK